MRFEGSVVRYGPERVQEEVEVCASLGCGEEPIDGRGRRDGVDHGFMGGNAVAEAEQAPTRR